MLAPADNRYRVSRMLDDQSFSLRSDETIDALYQALLKAAEEFDLEADMNNGALTVEFEAPPAKFVVSRSEEHTSELQSLIRISYDAFGFKKNNPRHAPV